MDEKLLSKGKKIQFFYRTLLLLHFSYLSRKSCTEGFERKWMHEREKEYGLNHEREY